MQHKKLSKEPKWNEKLFAVLNYPWNVPFQIRIKILILNYIKKHVHYNMCMHGILMATCNSLYLKVHTMSDMKKLDIFFFPLTECATFTISVLHMFSTILFLGKDSIISHQSFCFFYGHQLYEVHIHTF